jgi:ribosomal protein L28
MLMCQLCEKKSRKISYSRHKKGSSGAGGTWALRAPITKKTQKPNLHIYKGMKLCSQCLRIVKRSVEANRAMPETVSTSTSA